METTRRMPSTFLLLCLSFACSAKADDWPQWMGPERDGVWRETGIVKSIPASGLPVKWRVPVSNGYSGPAVAGNRVFVMDYVESDGEVKNIPGEATKLQGEERMLCFNAANRRPHLET